jgi:hypothetical protein
VRDVSGKSLLWAMPWTGSNLSNPIVALPRQGAGLYESAILPRSLFI